MSKNSKLYWDMILGSEVVGYYKPQPEAYLIACEKLGIDIKDFGGIAGIS